MAITVTCRQCRAQVPDADINVSEGVAYCRPCGALMRLSDILEDAEHGVHESDEPPWGCTIQDDGVQVHVRARAFSLSAAGGVFFFAAFWNGCLSIFLCFAVGGTLQYCFGSVPSWFPMPPGQGMNSITSTLGGVIFIWLFLSPFIGIGLLMIGVLFTILFGHVQVRVRGSDSMVLTGVGPFGWKRSFDATKVARVYTGVTSYSINQGVREVILIDCGKAKLMKVGSILPEERMRWMAAVLRQMLMR